MDFGILGPLEVRTDDGPIAVPGAKQRILLAMLVLHAGEVVSADRLLDTIWGDDQPANPRNALQSQVSQLRRAFGAAGRGIVEARPPGYILLADAESIDSSRFERLVRDGRHHLRDGEYDRAADSLDAALTLWRGPPLDEFAGQGFADPVITRLTELRLGAIEDRIECDLRAGRHYELVPDLETLVHEHPLRERMRGQLMLALARAGRQAAALEVFHDTRQVLDDELGIDPSPELARLYETILRQADEPPPRSTAADRDRPPPAGPDFSTLPRPFSSFVGRDDDLDRVADLLAGSRLVTLTGPGGAGKTRLAVEAAVRVVETDLAPDGAWLVELAGLRDPTLLDETVAQALDLRAEAGLSSPVAGNAGGRITAALAGRRALLVLDNCEHLVEAAAHFARDLLARAGQVTVLCTSREALGVPGETVWSVTSLAVPPADTGEAPDELGRWGAVQLFVDRARATDPDFVLNEATAPLVVEVSRRLDGIPLALELAAARIRTLGLRELAGRLDDRFAVLTAGDRTAQPRQQTLRAVIEWSWDLLDDTERTLFRRLSVFAGGAVLPAIEDVCTDPDQLPAAAVVDVVTALADKSMITADRRHYPTRYRMLESLQAFAADRLAESGEETVLRSRHADHLHSVAATTVPQLRRAEQLEAMRRLDAERDDFRAAMRWLDESHDHARGARLATDLGWYWYLRGLRTEGLHWLATFSEGAEPRERALAQLWSMFLSPDPTGGAPLPSRLDAAATSLAEHGSPADRTFASLVGSVLYASLGAGSAAAEQRAVTRALVEQTGDVGDAAIADFVEGLARLMVGDLGGGLPWLEGALDRFTSLGDRWGQVQCLVALLSCAEMTGDLDAALRHADRGIELAGQLRLREMEAILSCRRATVATLAGEHDAAQHSLDRARRLADELGTEVVAGNVSLAAGFLALRSGRLDTAERHFEWVLDWIGESPYPAMRSYTLARLGTVAELNGDLDRAIRLLRESYVDATASGDPRSEAFALEGLAAAYATSGRHHDAAMLLGAAEARRASVGLPLPAAERTDVERAAAAARTHLGAAAFEAAADRGRSSGPEQLPLT